MASILVFGFRSQGRRSGSDQARHAPAPLNAAMATNAYVNKTPAARRRPAFCLQRAIQPT